MSRKDGKDRGLFERPKGSNTWWIRYADTCGNERREKIGTKSAARQAYGKRKEEARTGKKLGPLNRRPLTVEELLEQHLPEMLLGKKAKGQASYRKHAEFWRKKLGAEVAADVQPGDVEKIKAKMLATAAPATVNRSLTFLRRLFTLAVRDQRVLVNPLGQGRVKQMREANRRERFLNEKEETQIRAATQRSWWLMIWFSLHTGLRRGEQLGLRREHVDLNRRLALLVDTKAGEQQIARLNSVAVAILKEVLASHTSDWVFPGRDGGPRDGSAVSRRFQKQCVRLGIKDISWHSLRHTYISRLAMLGTPLPTLQKFARHKSIQMTLRYAHLCPGHEEQSLELLATSYGEDLAGPPKGKKHDQARQPKKARPALKSAPPQNTSRQCVEMSGLNRPTPSAL
ncbi:MAG: site-specific integrase [Vulcanimicrobiota bacterium]